MPLEHACRAGGISWPLQVALMGLKNVQIRLGKQDRPALDQRKRGRPAYEIVDGDALCDVWRNPGIVLAR